MVRRLLLILFIFFIATKPVYTDKSEFVSSQGDTLSVQYEEEDTLEDGGDEDENDYLCNTK